MSEPTGKLKFAYETIAKLQHQLSEAEAAKWVSVEDRLPEHMEPVLFNEGIGHYDQDAEAWYSRMQCSWPYRRCAYTPSHWMPLPEPPTAKEKRNYANAKNPY